MAVLDSGSNSVGKANVDANFNLNVTLPNVRTQSGYAKTIFENDSGSKTGIPDLTNPFIDESQRIRVGIESSLDFEAFCYTAQTTGKHTYATTTLTQTWNSTGLFTNGSSITTTTTGITSGTYAFFPFESNDVLKMCFTAGFSAQPVSNSIIDFGYFFRGAANPYAPTDGVYFRHDSGGLFGVANYNGTETLVGPLDFTYVNSQRYKFKIEISEQETSFWIKEGADAFVKYGVIVTPVAQGKPFLSASLPVSWRHAIVGGTASGVIQFQIADYTLTKSGLMVARSASDIGNAIYGSSYH
jgi:hypothetical protein